MRKPPLKRKSAAVIAESDAPLEGGHVYVRVTDKPVCDPWKDKFK